MLFDGSGREATARIASVSKGSAEAEVTGAVAVDREALVAVTLATAVPKGRRMDTLVRMCAELGVARIVPLTARRSVVKLPPGDADSGKHARWRKICLAASEQSGRNRLTEIAAAETVLTLCDRVSEHDLAVVLAPGAPLALPALLERCPDAKSVLLVLGPEGGLHAEEVALLAASGAHPARLTRSILRIETACVVAAATAVTAFER